MAFANGLGREKIMALCGVHAYLEKLMVFCSNLFHKEPVIPAKAGIHLLNKPLGKLEAFALVDRPGDRFRLSPE
jgi:hypothetical protein